jgi:glycosyltransferase involved in cell wall biosynthesis
MRICLITGIFPPDVGGPATYVSKLALALHASQHQVCVITLGDKQLPHPFLVKRVSRSYPWPGRLFLILLELLWHGWRSDVWYVNGLELPAILAGKLLRKRLVMKVVSDYAWERAGNQGLTTDTVQEFQTKKQHWKVEWHKTLRAWLTRQVETVITPSQHVKRLVCGWGIPDERVKVIYNAVDVSPESPGIQAEIRKQLGLPEQVFLVITVGRLIPLKGIDQLMLAIARLRETAKKEANIQLLIVGDGPEKQNLIACAQTLCATAWVHILGHVAHQRVLSYMRAADLFVLNSSTEGFSHVLLEAMMAGIPVIATAVGGNPELITHQENGILIAHGNLDELQSQIARVWSDEVFRTQLVQRATHQVQQYSWDRLCQQTMDILNVA